MGLIEYYAIFALATAFFSLIDIFIPNVKRAVDKGIINDFTCNPKLAYFVYFCINLLVAPIMILPITVPSMNARMYARIEEMVMQEAEF